MKAVRSLPLALVRAATPLAPTPRGPASPLAVRLLGLVAPLAVTLLGSVTPLAAQAARPPAAQPAHTPAAQRPAAKDLAPDLRPLIARRESELRLVVTRYLEDRAALLRRYDVPFGAERRSRLAEFYQAWRRQVDEVDFDRLSVDGRIDHILLARRIDYELGLLDREAGRVREVESLAPFLGTLTALPEARRRLEPPEPQKVARTLAQVSRQVDSVRLVVERPAAATEDSAVRRRRRIVAARTAATLDDLRTGALARWYGYYAGYDPIFTWWARDPFKRLDDALTRLVRALREKVVGYREGEDEPIIGDPVGANGFVDDLVLEFIPYGPEELIAIADAEYAWCLAEIKKAAAQMGFGDDWRAAMERVKERYVEPGKQPDLIRDLAFEAVDWVERRGWVTVPPLAREVWRMEMMSPERQKVSPFFLGGEVILVSYPTDGMEHDDKLMSMRGNNPHFSRATVQHELIPGHHLQGFMAARYSSHRDLFSTPFWSEGLAFYWEFRLWDDGFPRGPEDRIGMLFWRMHRAARIVFSLRVHLGTMTPDEAVTYLVEQVGHERANAEGEVRRSFDGSYPPIYQAAYMLGALQFRALHRELVGGGTMTERAFHDAVYQAGRMPVEMLRAHLRQERLPKDHRSSWRFYGEVAPRR